MGFRRNRAIRKSIAPPESPLSDYFESSNTAAYPLSAELQAFRGIIDERQALINPAVSAVKAAHENSDQTTPAPGPGAAPKAASGRAPQTVRELNIWKRGA